jgi:hypothetical protein
MRHPTGYLQSFGPDKTLEHDTFTCAHCNRIVVVKPKCDPADLGGLCKTCMKLICSECAAKGGCDPHEEKLRRAEAAYHFRRDAGLCV